MPELIAAAGVGAVAAAILGHRYNGHWFGGATAFWLSWTGMLICAAVSVAAGHLPNVPESSIEFIWLAFLGAAVGTAVGIIAARPSERDRQLASKFTELVTQSETLLNRYFGIVCTGVFVLGSIHFVENWSVVGFDLFQISEVRLRYLESGYSTTAKLASYSAFAGLALVVLLGIKDSVGNLSASRLVVLWIATVPHGLAFGGRGWTITPFVMYGMSLLLASSRAKRPVPMRRVAAIVGMVCFGLWIFTMLGAIRSGSDPEINLSPLGWENEELLMASSWIGSSAVAVGPHAEFAVSHPRSYGAMTLHYFAQKATNSGYFTEAPWQEWDDWRFTSLVREPVLGFTWSVPPTFIPHLIFDFGTFGMIWAVAIFVALFHWIAAKWSGAGIVRHMAAFLAFHALAGSIQTLNVVTSMTVVALTAAVGLAILLKTGSVIKSDNVARTAPTTRPLWR